MPILRVSVYTLFSLGRLLLWYSQGCSRNIDTHFPVSGPFPSWQVTIVLRLHVNSSCGGDPKVTPAIIQVLPSHFHLRMSKACDPLLINKVGECHPQYLYSVTYYYFDRQGRLTDPPPCQLDKTNRYTGKVHRAWSW